MFNFFYTKFGAVLRNIKEVICDTSQIWYKFVLPEIRKGQITPIVFFRIQRDFNHSLVLKSVTNFVIYGISKYSKLKKYLALKFKK